MCLIRIGIRQNLFYLLMLVIFNFLRNVDSIIIDQVVGLKSSLFLTFLMFLGEFIAGITIYCYQIKFLRKSTNPKYSSFMGVKLIKPPTDISAPDKCYKIYFLIFIISYFDFIEFTMKTFYIPKYQYISNSLPMRLGSLLTFSSAGLCYLLLRLQLYKHQIFSLLIIFICSVIILVFELIIEILYNNKNIINYIYVLFLVFINHFFTSFKDVIEKYLLEYDYINAFKVLMIEGIFGCVITYIYWLFEDSLNEIKDIYEQNTFKFFLLIICFTLFAFLSAGRNAYRVLTNKLYSPMTRTLTDSILDPFLIIFYYYGEKDFTIGENDEHNIFYFLINLILSIIINFWGCIYNEIIVLFFCGLEYNTHLVVSERANINHNEEDNYIEKNEILEIREFPNYIISFQNENENNNYN